MRSVHVGLLGLVLAGCSASSSVSEMVGDAKPAAFKAAQAPAPGPAAAPVARKIAYTAALELVVGDADQVRTRVTELAESHGGYVAKAEATSTAGLRRVSTFTVRVPTEKFSTLLQQLSSLGRVTRDVSDAQDVTEEFIDTEARLVNARAEEAALNRLLDNAKTVDEVLKTREQITRVRTDIDRTEGRLNYLTQSTTLATVMVTAREPDSYIPPDAPAAPALSGRVSSTLANSWDALQNTATGLVLVLVALIPWLPIVLVVALLIRWGLKRFLLWTGKWLRWLFSPARPPVPGEPFGNPVLIPPPPPSEPRG